MIGRSRADVVIDPLGFDPDQFQNEPPVGQVTPVRRIVPVALPGRVIVASVPSARRLNRFWVDRMIVNWHDSSPYQRQ